MKNFNSDEWYIWEQNACPMLLVLTLNPSFYDMKEYFGNCLFNTICLFEPDENGNYQGKWILRPDEGVSFGQKTVDMLLCPPYKNMHSEAMAIATERLLKKSKEIQFNKEIENLNNEQILKIFKELEKIYYDYYKLAAFIVEPVSFYTEPALNKYINKYMKDEDKGNVIRSLFTIDKDSFTIEILKHLKECSILLKEALQSNNDLYDEIKAIMNHNNFEEKATELILNNNCENLLKKVKEHSDHYYWKKNNYYSTTYITEKDVLKELFNKNSFDIDNPVSFYEETIRKTEKAKQEQLSQKSKYYAELPQYYRNIVDITNLSAESGDNRKKIVMTANSAFDKLFGVISKNTNVPIDDIKLLIPQELEYFIEAPQEYKERFEERKKSFLVIQTDFALMDEMIDIPQNKDEETILNWKVQSMKEPYIAEGNEVENALNKLDNRVNLFEGTKGDISILHGITAFYNKDENVILGKVKVIKDPKKESLEQDEILIAPSTTPDYIEFIHKCKAIITDWGGQTSHAAIVSREMKKPCIIGTNFATTILKNGDEIKIDLKNGMIEKIN